MFKDMWNSTIFVNQHVLLVTIAGKVDDFFVHLAIQEACIEAGPAVV